MTLNELLMVSLYSEYNDTCECQICKPKKYLYWGDPPTKCPRCIFRDLNVDNNCRCKKYVLAKVDSNHKPIRDQEGNILIETTEDGRPIEKWI